MPSLHGVASGCDVVTQHTSPDWLTVWFIHSNVCMLPVTNKLAVYQVIDACSVCCLALCYIITPKHCEINWVSYIWCEGVYTEHSIIIIIA